MGLDAFTSGDDEPEDDESEEQPTDGGFPSPERIGRSLREKALNSQLDIEDDGETLSGKPEEFGMAFALMFLDVDDADPYSLNDES